MTRESVDLITALKSIEFNRLNQNLVLTDREFNILQIIKKVFQGLKIANKGRIDWDTVQKRWGQITSDWKELERLGIIEESNDSLSKINQETIYQLFRKLENRDSQTNQMPFRIKYKTIQFLCLLVFNKSLQKCLNLSTKQLEESTDPIFVKYLEAYKLKKHYSQYKEILGLGFGIPNREAIHYEGLLKNSEANLSFCMINPNILKNIKYEDIFIDDLERIEYLRKAALANTCSEYPLVSRENFNLIRNQLINHAEVLLSLYIRAKSSNFKLKILNNYYLACDLLKTQYSIGQIIVINPDTFHNQAYECLYSVNNIGCMSFKRNPIRNLGTLTSRLNEVEADEINNAINEGISPSQIWKSIIEFNLSYMPRKTPRKFNLKPKTDIMRLR